MRNKSFIKNHLIRPDNEIVSFEYDALGRRTKKTFKGVSTSWVWDGNTPLHEWTDQQDVTTWLFEENSFAPIGKLKAEAKYNIISDYLGTPFEMYDQSGGRVWQGELDSFGAIQNFKGDTKTDCPFRYQGQYEDAETGLYYNRFRYYSPEEGLYLSQDPLRLGGGRAFYGYVRDTNVSVDPFGEVGEGIDWGQHLKDISGTNPPTDMIRPHAHHIVFKNGHANQQAILNQSKAILEKHDIDWLLGKENLVWAPNKSHNKDAAQKVLDALKDADKIGTKDAVVAALKTMGEKFADGTICS